MNRGVALVGGGLLAAALVSTSCTDEPTSKPSVECGAVTADRRELCAIGNELLAGDDRVRFVQEDEDQVLSLRLSLPHDLRRSLDEACRRPPCPLVTLTVDRLEPHVTGQETIARATVTASRWSASGNVESVAGEVDLRFAEFDEVLQAALTEALTGEKQGLLPGRGTTFILRTTDGVSGEYTFSGAFADSDAD